MKRACVVTYCEWTSYGSIMQSIGLKKALLQLGVESYIVKDQPAPVADSMPPLQLGRNPKQMFLYLVNLVRRNHLRRFYVNTVRFINQNVDVVYYNDYETLRNMPPMADYYIAGSDQIWNPTLCKPLFFLDFLGKGERRLSYAVSMGNMRIETSREQKFGQLVSGMASVSVRESEMKEVISQYSSEQVHVNIDPTFLQTPSEWRKLSREYPLKKPYVLVYAIHWDKKLNKELIKLHRETGYEIVALGRGFPAVWSNRWISDADPGQFLWLIDHAEAVVTSSFHGVAFSLIFNKKFAAIVNPAYPSRINNVLRTLHYSNSGIANVLDVEEQQYETVNRRIQEEKEKSMEYLKGIMEINE